MQDALVAHLRPPLDAHRAVAPAIRAFERDYVGGPLSVRDVALHVGLSQRRFIEVFLAQVGMRPKLFSRVRRFQRTLARAARAAQTTADATPDWARVAAACGYYDQSHLIHDFREFSGLTPAEYLRRRDVRVKENHVSLPSAAGQFSPIPAPPAPRR